MAYCVVEDVQKHRPHHAINATSKPTTAQVEGEIDNLGNRTEGKLAALGFVIPITGEISTRYLQTAISYGVAGLIEMQQRAGIGENDTAPRSVYWALYEQMIADIIANPAILVDAPRTDDEVSLGVSGAVIESFFTRYPTDDVNTGQRSRLENTAIPRFEMRKEF